MRMIRIKAINLANEGHRNYFAILVQIIEKMLAMLRHSYIITTSKQQTKRIKRND